MKNELLSEKSRSVILEGYAMPVEELSERFGNMEVKNENENASLYTCGYFVYFAGIIMSLISSKLLYYFTCYRYIVR